MGNPPDVKSLFPEFYACGTSSLLKIMNFDFFLQNIRKKRKKINKNSGSLS
jgi:hypothetical protein